MQIEQIRFKNYYTAILGIRWRARSHFFECTFLQILPFFQLSVPRYEIEIEIEDSLRESRSLRYLQVAKSGGSSGWRVCVGWLRLMPDQNAETGSQSDFLLSRETVPFAFTLHPPHTILDTPHSTDHTRMHLIIIYCIAVSMPPTCWSLVLVIVVCAQMSSVPTNAAALRFVLRQPSPIWREFRIEDIQLLGTPNSPAVPTSLTSVRTFSFVFA